MRSTRVVSVVLASALAFAWGVLAEQTPAPKPTPRPKVALVLSGGGARGAAQIGVLRVLEELRVPVDLLVGTSMGSIVGGLYATGWSPDEMEAFLSAIDLTEYFDDRVERRQRTFRRKQDDVPFLIQSRLRFRGFRPYLPTGVLGEQRLELLLRSVEVDSAGETDFDRLPVPYRAVACDLETGEVVVLDHGSLATAMRASMSIPGAFPPVELDGRVLIDGGSAANFPVGVAQQLGAERVIGVDISSPLTREEVWNAVGIYLQLTNFLTVANRDEDVSRMREGDVLIVPDLGDITFIDFKRVAEAVDIGEQAAWAQAEELRKLSVTEEEYAAFKAGHRRPSPSERVVDEVVLVNTSPVADEVVRRGISAPLGETLDHEQLEQDLMSLYNLEYFGLIQDRFERDGRHGRLIVETPAPRFGRASLQFGLSLYNDFGDTSLHAVTVRHRVLAVNRRGGEWVNVLQTGNTMLASTELYQPFDYGMAWFVEPAVELRRTDLPLWLDGEHVADYRWDRRQVRVDLGHVLGGWGELRVGVEVSDNSGESRSGLPFFPSVESTLSGGRLGFRVDTQDTPVFPTRGLRLDANFRQGLDQLGSDEGYRQAFLAVNGSMTMGRFTLTPGLEVGDNLGDRPSVFNLFPMGGFLRLTGLGDRELLGERSVLGRVLVYRRLARVVLGSFKIAAYAGLSLEAGNVFPEGGSATWSTLRTGGSVYVGLDTSAGPLYLAWGYTDGGRSRVHIRFGQSF